MIGVIIECSDEIVLGLEEVGLPGESDVLLLSDVEEVQGGHWYLEIGKEVDAFGEIVDVSKSCVAFVELRILVLVYCYEIVTVLVGVDIRTADGRTA